MPTFTLTYPEGALDPATREQLVDDLTTALLRAERAPETQFFRDITWAYVQELPRGSVLVAGRPAERPVFKLDVTTPEGALSDRRRAELVTEATRLIRAAAGIPHEEALRVWVLLHEMPEGRWGAGGEIVRFENLRQIAAREAAGAGA